MFNKMQTDNYNLKNQWTVDSEKNEFEVSQNRIFIVRNGVSVPPSFFLFSSPFLISPLSLETCNASLLDTHHGKIRKTENNYYKAMETHYL